MNRRWGLKSIVSLAVAAIATLVVSPSAHAQPRNGAVAGVVGSGAGVVEGATVKLMQGETQIATTESNAEGRFGFRDVPQGRYVVVASKEGVGRGRALSPVRANEVTNVRVVLSNPEVEPGAIRAHVGNATDGPIAGAAVVLMTNGRQVGSAVTNENGVAEFGRLRPGSYTLVAQKLGFTEGRSAVTVVSNQTVDTRVIIERLPSPGAILGGVFFNDAPVADAEVVLLSEGRVVTTVRSGRDGLFNFAGLRPGTYTVNAVKRGVGRGTAQVTVTAGNSTRARITLAP